MGARFHYNTGRLAPIFGSAGQYQDLPAFYQLDLRVDRRFVFDRFVLEVLADVANATATRQVVQLSATQDAATGMPGPVDQASFRLILLTLGVHGEFWTGS